MSCLTIYNTKYLNYIKDKIFIGGGIVLLKTNIFSSINNDYNGERRLYHGSYCEVVQPEIRFDKFYKDFGSGFYITNSEQQAIRFTSKFKQNRIINCYTLGNTEHLNIKLFETMSDEWLDFIADCRTGKTHNYDLVEGPMADDQVWEHVQAYLDGVLSRDLFWAFCKFRYPTHQICLCTEKALDCLKFIKSYEVVNNE